jgi:hypothetical protein
MKKNDLQFVSIKNSNDRSFIGLELFEFASLKEDILTVCMGHAMGGDDDFEIREDAAEAMEHFAKQIKDIPHFAILWHDDDQETPRAILNLKRIAYVRLHKRRMQGTGDLPTQSDDHEIEVLDVWYENYGFRLAEDDAIEMYETIAKIIGLEP